MRRSLPTALVLSVLLHTALAVAASHPKKLEPFSLEAVAPTGDGPPRIPDVPSSAYPYYQTLKQYTFEPAGAADPEGWTTHDLTAQGGVYWHVDDFSGLSGYAPLSGSKSMWCGVRTSTDPAYLNAPGYGDYWTQILESDPVPVVASQAVGLFATVTYDLEQDYDFVYVEYKSGGGPWTVLQTLNGTQLTPTPLVWAAPSGGSSIQFRFVMTSDYAVSDEDFSDTHGAIVVDDVRITNLGTAATYNFQNFEGASLNATVSGIWHGVAPPAFGNYAGLVSGSDVHQTGTPDNTFIWSFFNGSSATYACGGYPSQAAVPYTTTPGSTRPGDYIDNEIRSPWIDLSVDKNNQPVDPNMGAVGAAFDIYDENENLNNLVYYRIRCRFKIGGVLQPWLNDGPFYNGGGGWLAFTPLRTGSFVIPAGATHVQFGVGIIDDAFEHGGVATCHTPTPMLDNIAVQRFYRPYRVTNTNDSGVGSLRTAITSANNNPDFNLIFFTILGASAHTINLASPLPAITHPVWIDGFSQSGSFPNTQQFQSTSAQLKIALNGASAGAGANGLLFAPGSVGVVRGLAIGGFSGAGIRNECTSLITTGCYVGLDATGNVAAPNGTGILNMSQGMDIGGSYNEERMLISNSTGDGIRVMDGGTHIINCHLGYDALGFEMANQGEGIHVFKGFCQIGEPVAGGECLGEYTDRVWIEVSNITVEPAAQDVMIHQVVMEGGMIDLNYDGETANDPGDADSGGNGLQNYPVLTSVGSNTVSGDMDGAPNTSMRVEFYSGDGYQAQMHYLGYKDIITNGSGHASFSFSCAPIAPGTHIRATATAGNNTSEFGPWITYNNTNPGMSGIPINLYDTQQQLRATVQYTSVLSTGSTFLNEVTPSSTPIPSLWNVGGTPHYWDITNNVGYGGSVQVCVYYDPAQVPAPENMLRLLHYQNSQWVDVTTLVDPVNNQICGVVNSLSPFVVAIRTGATAVNDTPLPDAFSLHANVPNPFNPATTIDYDVPRGGAHVSIAVFDVSGRLVRTLVDEHRPAGRFDTRWNGLDDAGRPVASGVYFYRMQAGSFGATRKMILLK